MLLSIQSTFPMWGIMYYHVHGHNLNAQLNKPVVNLSRSQRLMPFHLVWYLRSAASPSEAKPLNVKCPWHLFSRVWPHFPPVQEPELRQVMPSSVLACSPPKEQLESLAGFFFLFLFLNVGNFRNFVKYFPIARLLKIMILIVFGRKNPNC